MVNLAQLAGGALLLTSSLLAGCSPDATATVDASSAGPGTGRAAANPGPAGGGPQNSGGGNTAFLAKVAEAPDRVARRGQRRVELNYADPGVIYREDVGADGKGNSSIELIEVLTPVADPELFQMLQDNRQVMTYRYRDWLIRDYDLFLLNYTHTVLDWSTVVAGRSCVQLEVISKDPGTQIYYVVDVDPTNGIVMRWEERDFSGQVLARVEYETYVPHGDVSDMTLLRRKLDTSTHDLEDDLVAIFGFEPLIPTLLPNSTFQLMPQIEKSILSISDGGSNSPWARVPVTDGLEIVLVMSQAADLNPDNGEGQLGLVDHMQLGTWGVLRGDLHGFPFIVAGKCSTDDLILILQSATDGR